MRHYLLCAVALLLASCASQPPRELPSTAVLLKDWQLEGKLAVAFNEKNHSASFQWHNSGDNYTIRIHGPLGQGNATLKRNNDRITLTAENQQQIARTAEELLTMNLGWSFPVSDMRWWIKGLPSPSTPIAYQEKNDLGQLTVLEQQGWQIKYLRYQQWEHLTLPYKLVASHHNVKITLLLKHWEQ